MTLRTQFSLSFSLLIIGVVLLISSTLFISQRQFLSTQMEEARARIFKDFSYTCTEALVVKDEIQVFNTIKSMIHTHHPALIYAGYASPSGTVLYQARDKVGGETLRGMIVPVASSVTREFADMRGEIIREYATPIYIQEHYAGTIKAGFSQSFMNRQIRDALMSVGRTLAGAALAALSAGIVIAYLLAYYLNRPIAALAEAADDIGKGNLDVRVRIAQKDELGRLGAAFNTMAHRLKQLDELKDSFVSSVSHELRSPLAAIDGYVDFLLEALGRDFPREKQERSLRIIKEATVRLTSFINNILDLAKIKAERLELRTATVKVRDIASSIVTLYEPLAHQQNKQLVLAVPDDLSPVEADADRVRQVITNLVGNAIKFTREGDSITVSARPGTALSPVVEVWVSDTGPGIPPEALDKIFDRFYQVCDASGMKKPKGTGLGLAIAAEIVKLHGGVIWAESAIGQGAVFKFTLPLAVE